MTTSASTTQLNLRIISIVVFTCICYLSIGLPLAVLPGYIHYQLGYSPFIAGVVISLQYISTLISRPHAAATPISGGRKKSSVGGLFAACSAVSSRCSRSCCNPRRRWPLPRCWWGAFSSASGKVLPPPARPCGGIKTVGAIHTSRVISWKRRGDLRRHGGRRPAGCHA
ncbi:transporter [Klebsiella michiganensis]|uniref:Transporter n=1 Tax=Klebsiella michiganensis TaxID=1134687 RepID=A0A7H4LS77_9ENTR|nr:transporter [Klebsiella michiganensis]